MLLRSLPAIKMRPPCLRFLNTAALKEQARLFYRLEIMDGERGAAKCVFRVLCVVAASCNYFEEVRSLEDDTNRDSLKIGIDAAFQTCFASELYIPLTCPPQSKVIIYHD